jgi:hypothetical protein
LIKTALVKNLSIFLVHGLSGVLSGISFLKEKTPLIEGENLKY